MQRLNVLTGELSVQQDRSGYAWRGVRGVVTTTKLNTTARSSTASTSPIARSRPVSTSAPTTPAVLVMAASDSAMA
jgi:hypothetical protein